MLSDKEFEELVKEAIDSLGEKFVKELNNVAIVIEKEPTPEQREKLNLQGKLLFGLYEGIPQTKRESYGMVLPDKITIFKNEIEKLYSDPFEIKKVVQEVVWHEVAHHFGMDEKQIKMRKRKK